MTRMQIRTSTMAVLAALAVVATGASSRAQEKPPPPPKPLIPLQVTVVISRYQGERADKRTSSLPFTMRVNANDRPTSVRMGADVPVPTSAFSKEAGAVVNSYSMRSIGTNIDCSAEAIEGGRYVLQLTVSDSQIQPPQKDMPATLPLGSQSFSSTHRLVIRDGETIQQTAATDKSTGETIKVDVTLNVVK
jgi:hypothetical protein